MGLACLLLGGVAHASGPRTLAWQDLQPPGEAAHNAEIARQIQERAYAAVRNGKVGAYQADFAGLMRQIRSDPVQELDGLRILLPGYMVPLDATSRGRTLEFLLVPFFGACLHVPAPPINQMAYVVARTPQPVGDLSLPVWIDGVLTIDRSAQGPASYRVDLIAVLPYEGKQVPYQGPVPHVGGD